MGIRAAKRTVGGKHIDLWRHVGNICFGGIGTIWYMHDFF
jgi:hypothetical protein